MTDRDRLFKELISTPLLSLWQPGLTE